MLNMVDNYKIAVLLPVYKNDKIDFLQRAVDSILTQSYKNIILHIGVDGPVNEDMRKCLENFGGKHSNVQITYFLENRGLAAVLNDLLDICIKKESIRL